MKYFLLLLLPLLSFAQPNSKNRYIEFNLSADANKLFQIIDNPRTIEDHKGLDWDFEITATDRRAAVYMFYGRFDAAKYQNYGMGFDYILFEKQHFTFKAGPGLSVILREQQFNLNTAWGSTLGYHFRGVGNLKLSNNISITGRIQYQRRPELHTGIVEGSIGVAYRFFRKI